MFLLICQLKNIGRISQEKTEIFDFDEEDDYHLATWHYAKRPIVRYMNRVFTFYMATFPTLDVVLGIHDNNRTTLRLSLNQRRTTFCNTWFRLLAVLFVEPSELSSEDRRLLRWFQEEASVALKINGLRPGMHFDKDGHFIVPPLFGTEDFGVVDPILAVAYAYEYEEEVRVSQGHCVEGFHGFGVGEEVLSVSCPVYTFLVKMGVLSQEKVYEMASRRLVGDRMFGMLILGRMKPLYRYTVDRRIPRSVYTLMPSTYR
jgi:hypothetical protein